MSIRNYYGGLAVDFSSAGVEYITASAGISPGGMPDWRGFLKDIGGILGGRNRLGTSGTFRHCDLQPIVNVFMWWCDNVGICSPTF